MNRNETTVQQLINGKTEGNILPMSTIHNENKIINNRVDSFTPFMGDFSIYSIIAVLLESFTLLALSIIILYLFQKKLNRQNQWVVNSYTAHIIHILIITVLVIPLLDAVLPSFLKFLLVSIVAIPIIFGSSAMIRQIPYNSKVLG